MLYNFSFKYDIMTYLKTEKIHAIYDSVIFQNSNIHFLLLKKWNKFLITIFRI